MATSSNTKKDAPTVEDLAGHFETLRGDTNRLTELVTAMGQDRVEHAGDNIQERAARLRARAERETEQLKARASDLAHEVQEFMHERPVTTIGLAMAFGFLVGMMGSRR